jgi:hypothetical protein
MLPKPIAFAFLATCFLQSCFFDSSADKSTGDSALQTKARILEAIAIDTSPSQQPVLRDQPVPLKADTTDFAAFASRSAAPPSQPSGYTFQWMATLPSPVVAGHVVQACDLSVDPSRAFVAYNDSGDPFNGAIAVVKLNGSGNSSVEDVVTFSGMDVNSIYSDPKSGKVYFAGQADPDIFGFRAFVASFDASQLSASAVAASIVPLPSYAGTSIVRVGNEIRVATGARNGRLVRLTPDLDTIGSVALADIRSVHASSTHSGNSLFASLTGGTDGGAGGIQLQNGSFSWETPLPEFVAPYARASVVAFQGANRWDDDEDAFVAAALSDKGLRLWRVKDGGIDSLWSIGNPSTSPKHTANSVSQSSMVSRSERLLFLAQGEYGMRVVSLGGHPVKDDARDRSVAFGSVVGVIPAPVVPGQPDASFNQVVFKDPFLVAATGRSGVQIYRMD